jgi:hypothetical protein
MAGSRLEAPEVADRRPNGRRAVRRWGGVGMRDNRGCSRLGRHRAQRTLRVAPLNQGFMGRPHIPHIAQTRILFCAICGPSRSALSRAFLHPWEPCPGPSEKNLKLPLDICILLLHTSRREHGSGPCPRNRDPPAAPQASGLPLRHPCPARLRGPF